MSKYFLGWAVGLCMGILYVVFLDWYIPDDPPYLPSPSTAVLVLPSHKDVIMWCNLGEKTDYNLEIPAPIKTCFELRINGELMLQWYDELDETGFDEEIGCDDPDCEICYPNYETDEE